jgi:flagellar assembly factor FliW
VKCRTTRFGTLELKEEAILVFPSGILGFPEWTQYVLLDHDTDAPIKWLQCIENPDLAFVVLDPLYFKSDYQVVMGQDATAELDSREGDDVSVVTILTIPSDDPSRVTANLRGPLVMNHRTRRCKQLVLSDDIPTRYPLFDMPAGQASVPAKPLQTAAC